MAMDTLMLLVIIALVLQAVTLTLVFFMHQRVIYLEQEMVRVRSIVSSVQHSVTTTQGQLRTRLRSDETRAHVDPKPKVEQPYAGQGVQRTAPGTEAGTASGESPAARAVKVTRISVGGKDSEDPNSRLQRG